MTDGAQNCPHIFISYAQGTLEHDRWVVDLANRLASDGVDVLLDKWSLRPGQDAYKFMEQMVSNSNVTYVLLICDRRYKEKADGRKGGVGTESQIVSKEIYENTEQQKFIAIVKEHDDQNKPCVPIFISGRIYIDLSTPEKFEAGYDTLIRHLWNKPLHAKPTVGQMPGHLNVQENEDIPGLDKIRRAVTLLESDSRLADNAVEEAANSIVAAIEAVPRIDFQKAQKPHDEVVLEAIEELTPIRNAFIQLMLSLAKAQKGVVEHLQPVFESLITRCHPSGGGSYNELEFDQFRFLGYECELYLVAALLKSKRYAEVNTFASTTLFYKEFGSTKASSYRFFHSHVQSLDQVRNRRLNLNRTSVVADEIKRRATDSDISFIDLQEADCILYARTRLKEDGFMFWWPVTLVYKDQLSNGRPNIFNRMCSKAHFDKVKTLFEATSADDLKKKIKEADQRLSTSGVSLGWESRYIPNLEHLFDASKLAQLP